MDSRCYHGLGGKVFGLVEDGYREKYGEAIFF
jgi:hypothetical protein